MNWSVLADNRSTQLILSELHRLFAFEFLVLDLQPVLSDGKTFHIAAKRWNIARRMTSRCLPRCRSIPETRTYLAW